MQSIKVFGIEVSTAAHVGQVTALADGALDSVVEQFDRILTATPTFEQWEAARVQWRTGYAEQKPGVSVNALDKAWSRFASHLTTTKPKATSAEAVKKAESRADPFADLPKADVAAKVAELKAEITAQAVPKAETAKAYTQATKALEKLEKAEAKVKADAEASATKKRRETVTAYVKACPADVLALFEALADATNPANPEPARARAWDLIRAVTPSTKPAKPAKPAEAKAA